MTVTIFVQSCFHHILTLSFLSSFFIFLFFSNDFSELARIVETGNLRVTESQEKRAWEMIRSNLTRSIEWYKSPPEEEDSLHQRFYRVARDVLQNCWEIVDSSSST